MSSTLPSSPSVSESNVSRTSHCALLLTQVPIDAVDVVRKLVEALLITHTEAKLNTASRLLRTEGNDENQEDAQLVSRGEWCRNVAVHHYDG